MTLYATILAGGSGTRFWPLSRTTQPKQFLVLEGDHSLLQNTVRRIAPLIPADRTYIVTAAHQQAQTRDQLPELPAANVVCEPLGRNTAAAAGLAACHLLAHDPDATMVVLPADHVIPDHAAFCDSLRLAADAVARHDVLMTLGVHPTFPATGYGYIKAGPPLTTPPASPARRADQFVEKPPADVAVRFLASGAYYWNCGIFVWRAATLLDELHTHLPDLWQGLHAYVEAQQAGADAETLHQRYAALRSISIDHGVLEHSNRVGVLPVTFAWSDVGSWRSLADLHTANADGNVVIGQHVGLASHNLIVYSPDKLIATIGLTDLIIVHAQDALLICPQGRDQDVRDLVELLKQRGLSAYL